MSEKPRKPYMCADSVGLRPADHVIFRELETALAKNFHIIALQELILIPTSWVFALPKVKNNDIIYIC